VWVNEQAIEQIVALHKEQIDRLKISVGREQNVTLVHLDPRPPVRNIPLPPVIHYVDLVPKRPQIRIGFVRMRPLPEEPLDQARARSTQVFEDSEMSAAFQRGSYLDPWHVAVADTSPAQFNEVHIRRLERTDPRKESPAGRSVYVGPVARAAHSPAEVFQVGPHRAMIQLRPLQTAQRCEFRIGHR